MMQEHESVMTPMAAVTKWHHDVYKMCEGSGRLPERLV